MTARRSDNRSLKNAAAARGMGMPWLARKTPRSNSPALPGVVVKAKPER